MSDAPPPLPPPAPTDERPKFCFRCGQAMEASAPTCPQCGAGQLTPAIYNAPPVVQQPPSTSETNGMAIASLVLGILWLYWIGSILAVIFGHIALGQIARSQGRSAGRGMALAGVILGYIGIAVLVIVILVAIIFLPQIQHSRGIPVGILT
jgi:hypothetical protein